LLKITLFSFASKRDTTFAKKNRCRTGRQSIPLPIFNDLPMKRKNTLILTGTLLFLLALVWYFASSDVSGDNTITVVAKRGQFVIEVTTTGELEARSSENIMGPNANGLRNARIHR